MRPLVDTLRWWVSRHPWTIVVVWGIVTALVVWFAPDLSKLAAEGQARLIPADSESARASRMIREGWPDQWFGSLAVLGLERPDGLTTADLEYAQSVVRALRTPGRPKVILRVLGTDSPPEIVERLVSQDGTLLLTLIAIDDSFVSPRSMAAVGWVENRVRTTEGNRPPGLGVVWTGESVIGRDYMLDVQRTLDRAMYVTIVLLLAVLLIVYRSFWLSLVPLATIGVALVVSRGLLGWMAEAGWEVSPLVELFLVVILFGCGTDYGLFLSWRYGEHWNPTNPAAALRTTMRRSWLALTASALTTIAGLSLMGLTKFKLFSSTGPSVAIGLLITLVASLTLTPALLLMLAWVRPQAYRGMSAPPSRAWEGLARAALARPWLAWSLTVLFMLPAAILGLKLTAQNDFLQDTISELSPRVASVADLHRVADRFGPGMTAPLTIVVTSDRDLRESQGLALIDDISRQLARSRDLSEVRSATQPLGSTVPLEPARLAARLSAVDEGFGRMAEGARRLEAGLTEGAAKLRVAMALERWTGLSFTGESAKDPAAPPPSEPRKEPPPANRPAAFAPMTSGLVQATSGLLGAAWPAQEEPKAAAAAATTSTDGPREQLLRELSRAAQGATQIAEGADRARTEIASILDDPVGHRALDRLLIRPENVAQNPGLTRAFRAYLSEDGKTARIDVLQRERPFSPGSLDHVERLRHRLADSFGDLNDGGPRLNFTIAGANAASADIRSITRRDQAQSWIVVPLGVFLVLLVGLRSPLACLNLVGTMMLTYAFSLGVTHAVFVWGFGFEGIDWKVPYFLFVLLVAVGVDYNVFLMSRLQEEVRSTGLLAGIIRSVAQTGGLISSAAAITVCSFAALMFSPLASLQQLGFALVLGITVDALLVRPLLVPCGHWLMNRHREPRPRRKSYLPPVSPGRIRLVDS